MVDLRLDRKHKSHQRLLSPFAIKREKLHLGSYSSCFLFLIYKNKIHQHKTSTSSLNSIALHLLRLSLPFLLHYSPQQEKNVPKSPLKIKTFLDSKSFYVNWSVYTDPSPPLHLLFPYSYFSFFSRLRTGVYAHYFNHFC